MEKSILQARDVCFSYGSRQVLYDIDLALPSSAFVSIVGPNGSGKTTLFRLLCGARQCTRGEVTYEGRDVAKLGVTERARRFAVVHQGEESCFPFTCLEMVLLGLYPHRSRFGGPTPEQLVLAREAMEGVGAAALAEQQITQVSGGELQRVILARALVQRPRVLFLDEAMSELDIRARLETSEYLRGLITRTGLTVVAVNHDLASAYRHSDWIVALKAGAVAAQGEPGTLMRESFFQEVFGVDAKIFDGQGFFIQSVCNK